MSKFKVGDTAYVKDGEYQGHPEGSDYNIPRCGMKVNRFGRGYIILNLPQGGVTPPLNPDMFSTMPSAPSPIRTVTRKEIVPGVYGNISIAVTSNKYVGVHINSNMDAAELREAAHTLNQIAEALEHD